MQVCTPHLAVEVGKGAKGIVDAILWTHHAEVAPEKALAPLEDRVRLNWDEPRKIGSAAHYSDAITRHVSALDRGIAVALVRADHRVSSSEGEAFEHTGHPVQHTRSSLEARLEQLGDKVMVIEEEARSALAQCQRNQEQQVGRIACVDNVKGLVS
jgi:hypothetical protein